MFDPLKMMNCLEYAAEHPSETRDYRLCSYSGHAATIPVTALKEAIDFIRATIITIQNMKKRIDELEKVGTPRILTKDELSTLPVGTVVWEDNRNDPDDPEEWLPMIPICFDGLATHTFEDWGDAIDVILSPQGMDYLCDYGKDFVYWTARPTKEQREAVKWDG